MAYLHMQKNGENKNTEKQKEKLLCLRDAETPGGFSLKQTKKKRQTKDDKQTQVKRRQKLNEIKFGTDCEFVMKYECVSAGKN